MKTLGVILARGGSKGIPKKNIKPLAGKPLIAYTIEAALKSEIFTHVVVSTDSKEIASVAREHGALAPFERPDELAQDHVWSRDALKHAVLASEGLFNVTYDYVFELPCVAPLRTEKHIREVFSKLVETECDSVTSITLEHDKHPVRMKRIVDDKIQNFTTEFPEGEGSRRQDLEPCYVRNGAIFAMTRDCIVKDFSRHGEICRPYVMSLETSVNIDTMLEFKFAEFLIKERDGN